MAGSYFSALGLLGLGHCQLVLASGDSPDKSNPVFLQGGVETRRQADGLQGQLEDRGGAPLRIRRPLLDPAPVPAPPPPPPFSLEAQQFNLNTARFRILSNYQLELIIDRSLSMRKPDCPGGLSRWDWCAMQAVGVARGLTPYIANGLTVTRFAGDFDVHEHVSEGEVVDILSRHDFQLGTRLCEPLAARLNQYFARRRPGSKPLLIAVITDGRPWPRPEPMMVAEELVAASRQMADAGEVTVVFFQIGSDDPRGRSYLLELGTQLTGLGARYQFVHTKTFEELEAKGLARALFDAVSADSRAVRLSMP
jgi:hypothetical protein